MAASGVVCGIFSLTSKPCLVVNNVVGQQCHRGWRLCDPVFVNPFRQRTILRSRWPWPWRLFLRACRPSSPHVWRWAPALWPRRTPLSGVIRLPSKVYRRALGPLIFMTGNGGAVFSLVAILLRGRTAFRLQGYMTIFDYLTTSSFNC